ncbi:glycosyltransferase family 4 protein [Thalassotalea agarivorans]
MATRLAAKGEDVTLVTSSAFIENEFDLQKGWNELSVSGVKVWAYKQAYSNEMSFTQRLKAFILFAYHSYKKSAETKADIVFATSTPLTIALPAVLASKKRKIPLVFEVRDLWPEAPIAIGALKHPILIWLAKKLEAWAYKHSTQIIALSPGMSEGVKAVDSRAKVTTIPNAADIKLFESFTDTLPNFITEEPSLERRKILTYTGTFGEVNNLTYLINLAEQLKAIDSNVAIVLIGKGKERGYLEKLALDKQVLNEYFYIFNPVQKRELADVLKHSDMMISTVKPIPELWKNSANKFFDALAAGKPIAINHGGWQADLIQNEKLGIVLSSNKPEDAAHLLHDSMNDKDLLKALGNNAKRLAVDKFSRDILFEKFHQALKKAAEK